MLDFGLSELANKDIPSLSGTLDTLHGESESGSSARAAFGIMYFPPSVLMPTVCKVVFLGDDFPAAVFKPKSVHRATCALVSQGVVGSSLKQIISTSLPESYKRLA